MLKKDEKYSKILMAIVFGRDYYEESIWFNLFAEKYIEYK